jgi:hydrogenase maturation protease
LSLWEINLSDKIVVLGIGNILLRDEGIGVRVVEKLREIGLPENVEIHDGATLGLSLLNLLSGCKKAIIVDAVLGGGKPGDIYRFKLKDVLNINEKGNLLSMHDIDFVTAFRMGAEFLNLPDDIVVVGIEPATFEEGLELSEEVEKAVPEVIKLILEEIKEEIKEETDSGI